jgi:cellulose synthase/poly-beta-1,6-N-acetylglucosamine synthase-like glycosyltransferase
MSNVRRLAAMRHNPLHEHNRPPMAILFQISALVLFSATAWLSLAVMARQFVFSLQAMRRPQASPFSQVEISQWPPITILVPAHNEERVIAGCLDHLLALDYPQDRLQILVVNDRSRDNTKRIVDGFVSRYGSRITALHRPFDATPGKPAAIQDALTLTEGAVAVFFDADYLPMPNLLKKLVAPFIDPTVGATMGRVVPYNTNINLLTRLLDLERRSGYTVDQAMRGMWQLLPQFGGTVGGIRLSAMAAVGGWSQDTLAEDTDLTYRLFCGGWTVEYVDDATCYEESPEDWRVRFKQVRRWSCGHDQCLMRYFWPTLSTPRQPFICRLDAALVLTFYLLPPLSVATLAVGLVYPLYFSFPPFNFAIVSAVSFVVGFGNISPYFQIIAAAIRDRQSISILALPLLFVSSAISMLAATQGLYFALKSMLQLSTLGWDKTDRYRRTTVA